MNNLKRFKESLQYKTFFLKNKLEIYYNLQKEKKITQNQEIPQKFSLYRFKLFTICLFVNQPKVKKNQLKTPKSHFLDPIHFGIFIGLVFRISVKVSSNHLKLWYIIKIHQIFLYLLSLLTYFIFFLLLFIHCLFLTITVGPNPYPRSVNSSRLLTGWILIAGEF